jgi:cobalamin biosynthesis protein CobW
VIVNEFGELGIDGDILRSCSLGCEDEGGESGIFELANGCLCCTVQEEFFPVMRELAERRADIDHILIETSGLALPKPLVQAFNWPEIRSACTVDAVITVVDTPAVAAGQFAADPRAVDAQRRADENLDHDSSLHELFEDQLFAADLIILNKVDLVDGEQLAQVHARVGAEIPPEVKVLESHHGRLDLDLLLGLDSASEETIHRRDDHHSRHHGADGEHDHDHDQFDSVVIELGETDQALLIQVLETLVATHTIYRVKGFVAVPGKAMRLLVQGVGRRFEHHFDRRWAEGEPRLTRLVFIGSDLDIDRLARALNQQLALVA